MKIYQELPWTEIVKEKKIRVREKPVIRKYLIAECPWEGQKNKLVAQRKTKEVWK